jgi:tetratricopeptide (TPR) repeat protein
MDLLQQAQKEENRWSLFDNKEKYENAGDLYEKAGHRFKLDINHEEAANAYVKAGDSYERIKQSYYSIKNYFEAAKQFNYFDSKRAIVYFVKVKDYYELTGDAVKAGDILEQIAAIDSNNAITLYLRAISYYVESNNVSKANKARLKLCDIYLNDKNYELAGKLYETIAIESDSKMSWISMEHYINACICWLALHNYELAHQKLVYYTETNPKISMNIKYNYLRDMIQACVDCKFQNFIDATYQFDQRHTLISWMVIALTNVREHLLEISDNIL